MLFSRSDLFWLGGDFLVGCGLCWFVMGIKCGSSALDSVKIMLRMDEFI